MYLVLVCIFINIYAHAHQSSLASSGRELFWSNPSVPVSIGTTTPDMSRSSAMAIIQASFTQWNQISTANINTASSSVNEVKFQTNFPYGSGVIGVTEVSFSSSGSISKAVIVLNDDYYFHSVPGLYPPGQVYLGDVVSHEVGHLFGLSHSEVLDSTMFYSSFSGQSTIAFDDRSGLRQKYDSNFGTITGHVKGGNHIGVLGVHVQAISRRTGEVSSAITDENGLFKLGGLDLNDTYYLYTSPIKNPDSLPGYFSNTQDEFCPASYVGSFFSACGSENNGKPQGITLTESMSEVNVGEVSIHCSLKSDQFYIQEKLKTAVIVSQDLTRTSSPTVICGEAPDLKYVVKSAFTPLTIYDYAVDEKSEKAFVGWFRKSLTSEWSLSDLLKVDLSTYQNNLTSKYLKVSLVSYPFGGQVEYEMTVKQNGNFVSTASRSKTYSSATGTFQTDFSSLIPLSGASSANIFEISVRSKKLESSCVRQTFPSNDIFTSDSHLPYLLITSIWEDSPTGPRPVIDTDVNLSDNYACLDAPFTYAVSKTREVSENSSIKSSQAAAATSCGTIDPPSDGPPGSSLPLIAMGFLISWLTSTLIKSRKKFLS